MNKEKKEQKQNILTIRASYHQERLWIIDTFERGELYETGPLYHNIPLILEIKGTPGIHLLEESLKTVSKRHEVLRTRMVVKDNQLYQQVEPEPENRIHVKDINPETGKNPLEAAVEESQTPFLIAGGPLTRATLITFTPISRAEGTRSFLVITLHHMIADAESLEIIYHELVSIYRALAGGLSPGLAEVPLHYADFSQWQRELPEEFLEPLLFYWKRQLAGIKPLELPTDNPRAPIHIFQPARESFQWDREFRTGIKEFCRKRDIEPRVLLLAAFKVLLHRYCDQEDITVGTVEPNRHLQGTANLVGPAANLLVLRTQIRGTSSFLKLAQQLGHTWEEAGQHRDIPFDWLAAQLNPEKDMSRTVFFDVLFQYDPHPLPVETAGSLEIHYHETNLGWGKYDFNLLLQDNGQTITGYLVYNAEYYRRSTARRLLGHYHMLLRGILENPHQSAASIPLLTAGEKKQLLIDWDQTGVSYPRDTTIVDIFTRQAEAAPHTTAVVYENQSLTYGGLNQKARDLAVDLKRKGVRPEIVVGLLVERSLAVITGIVGILKAGGAYLPIDPEYPGERKQYMLDDSDARILLTTVGPVSRGDPLWSPCPRKSTISLGGHGDPPLQSVSSSTLTSTSTCQVSPTNLAYIIYTSGTTGRPKGVMVEHRNLVRLFFNDRFPFDFNNSDIWTMFHSPCFDFSVWEIWGALLYGGRLIVISKQGARDTASFHQLLGRHGVTVLNQTPSAFYSLIHQELQPGRPRGTLNLRYVIFGGEALSPVRLKQWRQKYPGTKLVNMFGITETTVHVTWKELTADDINRNLNIVGKPLPTLSVYIRGPRRELLPIGIFGEIVISGLGVARGYLNQPGLTHEKFDRDLWDYQDKEVPCGRIINAFGERDAHEIHELPRIGTTSNKKFLRGGPGGALFSKSAPPGRRRQRLYHSGDRGRYLENGDIQYAGRIDHQVQIRGFRVEPGEIENTLISIKGIKEAVVTSGEDKPGDIYLCAYIVCEDRLDIPVIRRCLGERLPDYMIPAYFVQVEAIPLDPNGKVDRGALPGPRLKAGPSEYTAPASPLESRLVKIWSEVLGLDREIIGVEANFFQLGGHSLKATVLAADVHREFDVKIPIAEIFKAPTIREMAAYIETAARLAEAGQYASIAPLEKKEYYPLSPAQKRLYILQQLVPGTTGYNVSYPVYLEKEIAGDVDRVRLERVIKSLAARHDSLRTSFVVINRQPYQRVYETVDFSIEHHEAGGQEPGELIPRLLRPFELLDVPLFRVHLVESGTRARLLLFDLHHIITDAASLEILEQEFKDLYRHPWQELGPLRLQYKDYSQWQSSRERQIAIKQQQVFWLEEFAPGQGLDPGGELPVMNLPMDYSRPLMQGFAGNQLSFTLSSEETEIIKKIARDNETTLFMTLLALFNILFSKLSGQEDIILGTPIAARVHADLWKVTGMFVNTIALRNYPLARKTFRVFLQEVKTRTLKAFENQEYPFEELVEHLAVSRDTSRNPVFDVMFNWLSRGETRETLDEAVVQEMEALSANTYKHRESTARFDLVFSAREWGKHIYFTIEYSTSLFKACTIDRCINYLRTLVRDLPGKTHMRLSDLGIIPGEEIREILQLSTGNQAETPGTTIQQWYQHQAEKTPHHIALEGPTLQHSNSLKRGVMHLSYRELNEKANQLAHLLRKKGIGPDSVVGLMLERSVEMIIGILGILKAGGVYLPIDPGHPGERISTVLNDSSAPLLLTSGNLLGQISITKVKNMKLEGETVTITPAREQIKEFDKLPIPDRTLIDYRKYHQYIGEAPAKHTITLQATRGCPYHCLYCHKIWPKTHVARRAEHILQEISYAYEAGLRRFVFIDDIFNLDRANAARFLESIIKRKMHLQLFFPNGFRADLLDREFIDLMVAAGTVNLDVALESASPRIQRLIRKNLNLEKFQENVHYITKKYPQVILEMEIMHGFPTEAEKEALMTLEFLKQFQWVHFPNLHVLKIFPNTDMCQLAMEHGISRETIERSANLAFHELPDTLPFDKSFTRGFQARFMAEYFLDKKRLMDILPYQMRVLTRDELIQKYDSYLPFEVKSFNDILGYAGIDPAELGNMQFVKEDRYQAGEFCREISRYFPVKPQVPTRTALRILLLDLSQLFTRDHETMLHHQIEEPLGLLYIMTYLDERFKERIHGKVLKSRIDFDSFDEMRRIVLEFKPDIIGIRTLSFYKEFFHQAAAMIRQWRSEVPIIAGGPYATSDYQFILQDANVDLVVLGEGELTTAHLVEKMMENNNRLPGREVLQEIPGIAFVKNKPASHSQPRDYSKDRDILLLDQLYQRLAHYPRQNPKPVNHCHDLLYVIYTSGTTGQPKGVILEHGNLVNLMRHQFNYTNIDFSRVLQFTTIAFDVASQEIFSTLLAGGRLSLIHRETLTDVPGLFKRVEKDRIRTLFLPTSFLKFVMKEEDFLRLIPASVSHIVTAGEQLLVNEGLKRYLSKRGVYLHNHYGPSETHVVTALTLEPGKDIPAAPPIGRPLSNTVIYILDKGMNLVPVKVAGELFIGGVQVGRGYLNNPELTREKFDHDLWDFRDYQDGYHKSYKSYKSYIYRSGDLARWLSDGNIEFLGRIDSQVKIRGFRVELGEIETRLLNHPGVKEAVVQAKTSESGETYLCAYAVTEGDPDTSQLRQYLSGDLPDYMIPSYFVFLEKIPLTVNGKIDRRCLPDPQLKTNGKYIAPMNNDEKTLIKLWAEVLGIEGNIIGLDANFFELGGQSLKAIILTAKIHKELNVSLPLAEVFKAPTVRGLAQYIRKTVKDRYESIKPVEKKEYYVLSSAQARLYILQQMDLQSTAYNMPEIITLSNEVELNRLKKAFKGLIQRHDSLRTSFEMKEGEPIQRIYDEIEFEIEYKEIKVKVKVEVEEERSSLLEGTRGLAPLSMEPAAAFSSNPQSAAAHISSFIRPFDLSCAPLLRVGLIKLPHTPAALRDHRHFSQEGIEGKYLLLVDMHHIISDGISHQILVRDFQALYEDQMLPFLRIQYKDFSTWQNSEKEEEKIIKQERYWLKEFAGEIPVLELPMDYPRPAVQKFTGSTVRFEVSPGDTRALKDLALRSEATLYMVLLTMFNILLSRLSGQEDIIIGTPIAGRRHTDLQGIMGMFVNTLAVRNYPNGEKKFSQFLCEVKDRTLQAFENQEYQFEDLVERIEVNRDASRNPLFDTVILLQDFDRPPGGPGLENHPEPGQEYHDENSTAKFDLTLGFMESAGTIIGGINYCTHLFKTQTIRRFTGYLKTIINRVCKEEDLQLSWIEILPREEKERLLIEFNRTGTGYPRDKGIQQLFEEQVERTPDRAALEAPRLQNPGSAAPIPNQAVPGRLNAGSITHLSYRELNEKAGQLAQQLNNEGVQTDTIVGIMGERSVEMIIGILGILKAGGAYLPIDANYPEERIDYMLADSGARILLVDDSSRVSRLSSVPRALSYLSAVHHPGFPASHPHLPPVPAASLAYVIYTSGSTGRPKGVLVQHQGVVNLIVYHHKIFREKPGSRISQVASPAFDAMVFEIWPCLSAGAVLCVADNKTCMDPPQMKAWLIKYQITISFQSTLMAQKLLAEQWPGAGISLEVLRTAGDRLTGYPTRPYPFRFFNLYGPTEDTVWTTWTEVPVKPGEQTGLRPPPIGKPVGNKQVYILSRYMRIQPPGVSGELCIAGDGLARGYLNQPELTFDKFDRDIWDDMDYHHGYHRSYRSYKSHIIYKTGDLARWQEDGNIEFLGRKDRQVKIRGYRIETQEIENQLARHPGIRETAAAAMGSGEDKYLCAYVVLSPQGISEQKSSLASQLKKYLSSLLPDYMIPTYFVRLEQIPLTPNGKVDRKALPVPGIQAEKGYIAPRDKVEEKLEEIWSEVLGVERLKIGIDANFFELGGYSLKATRMISIIEQKFQVRVPLAEVFVNPTIRGLAQYMEKMEPGTLTVKDPYLVLLRKTAACDNHLFLVHDGSGEVEGYVEFCQHLQPPADFNCWGLRADIMGNNQYGPRDLTIREMASHYIEKIKKVQSRGPYYIAGWSLGGTIAFEMALQLEALGEKISFLGLIDAPSPREDREKQAAAFTLDAEIDWVREYLPDEEIIGKIRKALSIDETWSIIIHYLEENHSRVEDLKRVIPADLAQIIPNYAHLDPRKIIYYLNTNRTLNRARARYIPTANLTAALHFFKASESPGIYSERWNEYCLTPINCYEIIGNHLSIFKQPAVGQLSGIFNTLLNPGHKPGK